MEKWHATFKNLVATKNSPWTPGSKPVLDICSLSAKLLK